ncbi:unnamed protein product [Urochloa decumbens]|uniref:Uncharacterized protein n=1 Tax=Urochloa decumbens TaxID=240449 RepID=A0ABC9F382_9POAL
MRKEIIIRMQPDSDKGRRSNKALKVAASVNGTVLHPSCDWRVHLNFSGNDMEAYVRDIVESGVESVTVAGSGKDLLLVIGDGVDAGELIRKLKKEVGDAEIVELRTLPPPGAPTDAAVTRSPFQRWPGEQSRQAASYYHRTPSPGYYQHYAPSPMAAAHGGYGYGYAGSSLYARDVARSHPANYSPMIARHDLRAVGRAAQTAAAAAGSEGRDQHGGGGPDCCSIL